MNSVEVHSVTAIHIQKSWTISHCKGKNRACRSKSTDS